MRNICCRRWTILPWHPDHTGDPETANRACLLMAASRFARVFELAAPDAPGLISFGAQFDPALADSLHKGSPIVGVSGVGLTLQEAFQGCVGEGIEYLSQLQTESDLLLRPRIDDCAGKLGPMALELVASCRSAARSRRGRFRGFAPPGRPTDPRYCCRPTSACADRRRSANSRRRFR